MRKERRIGILRRFTIGLAVAVLVAPAAQARVDELGGAKGSTAGAAVIQGDDKVMLSGSGDSTVLIHGDDKVIVPWAGGSTVLIHGDDKVFAPEAADYALAGYRRALPQDYGNPSAVLVGDDKVIVPAPSDSTVLIHGDDKVFAPAPSDSTVLIHGDDKVIAPEAGDYTLAGYRRALPQDYGDPTAVPVGGLSSPDTFNWGDAFIGAGAAFALMLLAGAAALGTRGRERPAAA